MKQYHAFWIEPVGMRRRYAAFASEADVCNLMLKQQNEENVADLHVVYGELVRFEPATIVESFRICP